MWNLSLTPREEYGLGVFDKRVLGRIFGPRREEVIRCWRKLHNEEFYNMYSSLNIIRIIKSRISWAIHAARMGKTRNVYKILDGNTEEKRPPERLMRKWEDNIKMDIK
jgi:hypothetical protein